MQTLDSGVTQHHIVVVPCDRQTGRVPYQALVSVLSWHATRLVVRAASTSSDNNGQADDEDNEDEDDAVDGGCDVPAGGVDWLAVGRDGSDQYLVELQESVRDTLAHQVSSSGDDVARESVCRLVLVYLDCAPDSLAEAGFLRRLADRGVVVHVFGHCGEARALGLVGLPHVALHHRDGELPAEQVWDFARRRPPASLRPALALARFIQFCSVDYRLAVGEEFEKLTRALACSDLDQELTAWQVLDYIETHRPQLKVLADGARPTLEGVTPEAELLTEGTAFKDRVLRLSRGAAEPETFLSSDRLAGVVQAQKDLARMLASGQLVSVPLVASGVGGGGGGGGNGAVSNDSCAGRFAGVLLTPRLRLSEFGFSARPALEREMVRRRARFVAAIHPRAATQSDANPQHGWQIDCRRLDEADDCREAANGLLRLAGCRTKQQLHAVEEGKPWSATAELSPTALIALRMRLRLPADFGEEPTVHADADGVGEAAKDIDDDEEADATEE